MSQQNIPVNSIYAHDKENVHQHAFELGAVAILQNPVLDRRSSGSAISSEQIAADLADVRHSIHGGETVEGPKEGRARK